MESLSATIGRLGHGRLPDPRDDPDYVERYLLELPGTASIEAGLGRAREALAAISPDAVLARGRVADEVRWLERRLARARDRDRIRAGRPEGCWCLGLGGRRRVGVPGDEPVATWGEYCPCPDGERERAAVEVLVLERRRAAVQARLDRLWGDLPELYRDWTLESLAAISPAHARLATRVAAWLPSERWLYLQGPTGRAKTGTAIGALKALMAGGATGVFQDVSAFLQRLRDGYGDGETFRESHDAPFEALLGARVLVFDDLGAEYHRRAGEGPDWATEQLWRVVSHRHRERLRTVVTSNHSLGQLERLLGHPRIPDRIREFADVIDVSALPNLRARKEAA